MARDDNSKYLTKLVNKVFLWEIEEMDFTVGQSIRLINGKKLFNKKSITIHQSKELNEIKKNIVKRRRQPFLFKLNNGSSRKLGWELQPMDGVELKEDL